MKAYLECLKKYAVFAGRARRQEYWMFILVHILLSFLIGVVDVMVGTWDEAAGYGILSAVYYLAVLLPSLAVFVRRMHDTNRSGWWILLALVPLIGPIVLLVFLVQDSQPDANRFGPNPKA